MIQWCNNLIVHLNYSENENIVRDSALFLYAYVHMFMYKEMLIIWFKAAYA